MKNKLILLLFLLMPSLCFAESLHFIHYSSTKEKTYTISVVWSNFPQAQIGSTFKLHGNNIFVTDNKKSVETFSAYLKKIFPTAYKFHFKDSVLNKTNFNIYTLQAELRNWAVWENYAVTFLDSSTDADSHMVKQFFYKPDK